MLYFFGFAADDFQIQAFCYGQSVVHIQFALVFDVYENRSPIVMYTLKPISVYQTKILVNVYVKSWVM